MTEGKTSSGQRHPNHKPGGSPEYRGWSIGSRGFHTYLSGASAAYWRDEYADHPLGRRLSEIGMPLQRFQSLLAVRCGRLYTMDEIKAFFRTKRQAPPDQAHHDAMAEVLQVGVDEVTTWWVR